jgi:hypothetical protein
MTNYRPGDQITVLVDGKPYITTIDDRGVQRFKKNSIVESILDNSTEAFNAWNRGGHQGPQPWNLNTLIMDYYEGKHTTEEMVDFYTGSGYSVAGFAGLGWVQDKMVIRNPVWEENHATRLSSAAWYELVALAGVPYTSSSDQPSLFSVEMLAMGRWTTTNDGYYVAKKDTINNIVDEFLTGHDLQIWDLKVDDTASDELREFLATY